jgi:signal transduction histidine kinase
MVNYGRLQEDFRALLFDSERHRASGLRITIAGDVPTKNEIESVGLDSSRPFVRITYSDNGPGVPFELKDRIFDEFFSTAGGTGLGLAMVKHSAVVHGGDIVECGKPGKGARFQLYLASRGSAREKRTR